MFLIFLMYTYIYPLENLFIKGLPLAYTDSPVSFLFPVPMMVLSQQSGLAKSLQVSHLTVLDLHQINPSTV